MQPSSGPEDATGSDAFWLQKSPANVVRRGLSRPAMAGLTTAFAQQPEEAPKRVTPYSTVLGPSEGALEGRLRHPIRAKVFGTVDGK